MSTTIIFNDGTRLETETNGNCYITAEKPEFPDDLSKITVTGDEPREFANAFVQECTCLDDNYWFTFVEESQTDRVIRELGEESESLAEAIVELAAIIGGEE